MLPLALVLCGAVILPNFSLAYASIPFYQIVRETLTPIVDAMNFILRVPQPNVPRMALVSLLPMCIGVYIVTYYQYLAADEPGTEKSVGISAALFGVLVSACYITSMDLFQRRFQIDSRQLALNQAPLAGIALLYILPWADTFPNAREVPLGIWARLLLVRGMHTSRDMQLLFVLTSFRADCARAPSPFRRRMLPLKLAP